MGLSFEWLGLAEGAVVDQRGGLALVGFNPGFWQVASYPAPINLALVGVLGDSSPPEEWQPEVHVVISPTITDDDGHPLLAGQMEQTIRFPELPFRDPPARKRTVSAVVSLSFTAQHGGIYTASMRLAEPGQPAVQLESIFRVFSRPE